MADALEPCTFQDGDNIVTQGEQGEEFFIIVEVGWGEMCETMERVCVYECPDWSDVLRVFMSVLILIWSDVLMSFF